MFDDLDYQKKRKNSDNSQEREETDGPIKKNEAANMSDNLPTSQSTTRLPDNQGQAEGPEEPKSIAPPPPAVTEFDQRIRKLEEKGKRRGKRYSKIGIMASFLISLGAMYVGYYLLTEVIDFAGKTDESVGSTPEIRRDKGDKLILLDDWRVCSQDADCMETRKDCCDCQSGGEQTAINKQYLQEWESNLEKKCLDIGCITLYVCQEGRAVCENNRCEFKEDEQVKDEDIDTSDWQTYRNEELGFEFKYPEDWLKRKGDNMIIVEHKNLPSEFRDIHFSVELYDNSAKEELDLFLEPPEAEELYVFLEPTERSLEQVENVIIDNHKGYKIIDRVVRGYEDTVGYNIFLERDELTSFLIYMYYMKITENTDIDLDLLPEEEYAKLLDKIISTFKFIEAVLGEEARAKDRDSQRIAGIRQIQVGLLHYYNDENKYPREIIFGSSLQGQNSAVYISEIPKNITPGGTDYVYRCFDDNFYVLLFTLELDAPGNNLKKGLNIATQGEEFKAVDTDDDRLYDIEEEYYGTDINNPDTDGDGYLDGEEVKNGYNPNGEGRL